MCSIRVVLLQAGSALKPIRELRSRQALLTQNCGGLNHSYESFLSPVLECRHGGILWTVPLVQLHADRRVNFGRTSRRQKSEIHRTVKSFTWLVLSPEHSEVLPAL